MANQSIPHVLAEVELESLTDTKGMPVMLMKSTAEHYRAEGLTSVLIEVKLYRSEPAERWLTVTEAAQMAVAEEIVFGWSLETAKASISRDCCNGKIRHEGEGFQRRIDPASLRTWLMDRRRREIARADAEPDYDESHRPPPKQPPRQTVTLSEAARQHVSDVDGMTFDKARERIRRACEAGLIASTMDDTRRRVDADGLATWRLREREKDLNRRDCMSDIVGMRK